VGSSNFCLGRGRTGTALRLVSLTFVLDRQMRLFVFHCYNEIVEGNCLLIFD
jgi:hypothetical protein